MSDALERVTLVTPDPVAPEGHDEKMIALVDAKAAENSGRPDWLPAKFATAEDMAASYAALEAKQGGAKPEDVPAVSPAATPATDLAITPPAEATAAVAKAGLDMNELNTEFATAGTLSEASYAKLAAVGFDKAAVDNYVAGQQALQTAFQTEVMAVTPGGADKYGEMVAWAKVNMTPAQIDAYNASVGSGNKDQAKLAVAGLGASFKAAVGSEPNLQGGRVNGAVSDVFESLAQMKVAMSDPRYKTDHAYRSVVQQKLGRSNIM
jgi:hypothetical protein